MFSRRTACVGCILLTIYVISFFPNQKKKPTTLIIPIQFVDQASESPINVRAMQMAVMARRAAANHPASTLVQQPYQYQSQYRIPSAALSQQLHPVVSPTSQYYQPVPNTAQSAVLSHQMSSPSLASASRANGVGSTLSNEEKGAHFALSGALNDFHTAPLPSASVHSTSNIKSSSAALSAFHDKLYNIFTQPDSGHQASPQALSSAPTDDSSPQEDTKAQINQATSRFHDKLFNMFTSPSSTKSASQSLTKLPIQTVNNVISTSHDRVTGAKQRLAAFHDRLFKLFTASDDADMSAPVTDNTLKSDVQTLSRDALRLKAINAADKSSNQPTKPASIYSSVDHGFFALWSGHPATQHTKSVAAANLDPVLHVPVDRYGIPIHADVRPAVDHYGLPRDGAAAVPI